MLLFSVGDRETVWKNTHHTKSFVFINKTSWRGKRY